MKIRALYSLRWLGMACAVAAALWIGLYPGVSHARKGYQKGYVAARGVVLSKDGYPYWVEYNSTGGLFSAAGKIVNVIGEANGDLADAEVISRDQYIYQYGKDPGKGVKTLLITHDGDKAIVRYSSANNIALRTAYYTPKDKMDNPGDDPKEAAKDNPVDSLWMFKRGDKIWGPIKGARVEFGGWQTTSGDDGSYTLPYHMAVSCLPYSEEWNILAVLRFKVFDPQDKDQSGFYYVTRKALFLGGGDVEACPRGIYPVLQPVVDAMNDWYGEAWGLKNAALESMGYKLDFLNIPIDVMMVTGKAVMKNEARPGVDLPDKVAGTIPVSTETSYFTDQTVHTYGDNTDRWLLKQISEDDLEKTDIYMFRVSNDRLIAAQEGLGKNKTNWYYGGGGDNQGLAEVHYRLMLRGPDSFNYHNRAETIQQWQSAVHMDPDTSGYNWDYVKPGEYLKVIAVNRPTGYIGTAVVQMNYSEDGSGTLLNISPEEIILRPPNLNINVSRVFDVKMGLTAGDVHINTIGFEGSGLTDDAYIAIITGWVDWDGSPLPAGLPGYTGRLAKVIEPGKLGQPMIANFAINPGFCLQLVELPQKSVDAAHYHLHVNGAKSSDNPDFTTIGAAADGPLQYRPKHYVPVKVSVFNPSETFSNVLMSRSDALKDPKYNGVYRPEMQFSLLDFSESEVRFTSESGATFDYDPEKDLTVLTPDYHIDFTYTLLQDDPTLRPMLARFGPPRDMKFSFGGDIYNAEIANQSGAATGDSKSSFAWPGIASLDINDYLAIRLYQNGDDPNILWELAFLDLRRKEHQNCPPDTKKDQTTPSHSSVHDVLREYNDEKTDLSVKVPGGMLSVVRSYFGNQWHFDHQRYRLDIRRNDNGDIVEIRKGGIIYEKVSDTEFVDEKTFRINVVDTGFLWTDKFGKWKSYDESGNLTAYDDRNGALGKVAYENGQIAGLADKNDVQRIWLTTNADGWITSAHDSTGRSVTYIYTDGLLTSFTDVMGNVTTYTYDDQRRLAKKVEPNGRESNIYYDAYGYVEKALDQNGYGDRFYYDYNRTTEELYTRITSTTGRVKEVWYDRDQDTRRVDINGVTVKTIEKDGKDLVITDEHGNTTRKEYDDADNLTRIVYPDGSTKQYTYDQALNRVTQKIDERGVVTRYAYDDKGNLIQKTEACDTPRERATQYTYDADGNPLTRTIRGSDGSPDIVTTMTYDENGNVATLTDPQGNVTSFTHDVIGDVLTKTDPLGHVRENAYDAAGRLTQTTDPLGHTMHMTYDAAGNKTSQTDAQGNETTFAYDADNRMLARTDALGHTWQFLYNEDGDLTKQIDPEGRQVQYEYDRSGRRIKTIDGNGNEINVTYRGVSAGSGCSSCAGGASDQPETMTYPTFTRKYDYDARGRKTAETDYDGQTDLRTMSYGYDPSGSLLQKTDGEFNTTEYGYDALGRVTTVIDAAGNATHYSYDERDNLLSLTDAKGNTTRFEYDDDNRLIKETRPMGQETSYTYDAVGNLVEKIDAKNQKTSYGYDDAGRLITIDYFASVGDTSPEKTVTFTYDATGNLTGYDDGATSASYTYDAAGRKTAGAVNFDGFTKTVSYAYYANGTKKSFTDPAGVAYTYDYDGNNQLQNVHIPGAGPITIDSYTWNRPAQMTLPNGVVTGYNYDPLMRMRGITAKNAAGADVLNYAYTHDKVDNIIAKTTEQGNHAYGYDKLYRLTNVDNPLSEDEAFTYDPVGNRLTSADIEGPWNYNANNALVAYDSISFDYDDNGNMVRKTMAGDVTQFFYNPEDRLASVKDGSDNLIASYQYDPFGRRLVKDVGGTRTYFMYADEGLVAEMDAAGNVVKSYGWKPGGTWGTDPLFMTEDTNGDGAVEYYFYHNDHLGTPQKMTGMDGAVVWSAKYESFGKAVVEVETVENNLRFPGQYWDGETELNYNYHRFYDPRTGRYLRADPIGLMEGTNLFVYVQNSPLRFIDPLGKCKWTGVFSILGVSAGGGGATGLLKIESKCCNGKKAGGEYIWTAAGAMPGPSAISSSWSEVELSGPKTPSKNDPVGFSIILLVVLQ